MFHEEKKQIKMRAERITSTSDNCYILTETKPKTSSNKLKRSSPEIVIIDSNPSYRLYESTAGSISQIRETTAELIKFAKETNIPLFLLAILPKTEHSRPKNIGTYG
jgi:DNA repair protein RadA/Sms